MVKLCPVHSWTVTLDLPHWAAVLPLPLCATNEPARFVAERQVVDLVGCAKGTGDCSLFCHLSVALLLAETLAEGDSQ